MMIRTNSNRLALCCLLLVNIGYLGDRLVYSFYTCAFRQITSEQGYKPLALLFLPEVAHMEQSFGKCIITVKVK